MPGSCYVGGQGLQVGFSGDLAEYDEYSFNAAPGEHVSFAVDDQLPTKPVSGPGQVEVFFTDTSSNELDLPGAHQVITSADFPGVVDMTFPARGTYRIGLLGLARWPLGLTFHRDLQRSLIVGGSNTLNLDEYGQRGLFTFTVTAGQKIVVTPGSLNFRPFGDLYDLWLVAPDGTQLGSPVRFAADLRTGQVAPPSFTATLPSAGRWTLVVDPVDLNQGVMSFTATLGSA